MTSASVADEAASPPPDAREFITGDLVRPADAGARGRSPVSTFARLAPLLARHWVHVALALLFMVLAIGAQLALTAGARLLVDRGFQPQDASTLTRNFLLVGVVVGVFAACSALRLYFAHGLGERVISDLRRAVFDHVLKLDSAHFLKVRMGEVLSRMTADMTVVEIVVGDYAHIAVRSILVLTSALVLLTIINPGLAGMVLLLLAAVLAPLALYGGRVRRHSRAAQARLAASMTLAGESLDGLETVQAFGREDAVSRRFAEASQVALDAGLRRIRAKASMNGLLILLAFGGVLALLFKAANDVYVHKSLTGGSLVQMLLLSMLAGSAMRDLGNVWGEVQRASAALERIGELLDAEPAIAAPAHPVALPAPARGEIRFDKVDFAYPGRTDDPALHGFDLHVRPGERVALVGPSGAGKSTVFRLLLRFYDVDGGAVSIDGVDVRSADPHDVRSRIALVAQDAALFSGSARENIGFGRAGATPDDIQAAARAAQADGFVSSLPAGYDSPVGERGKGLSGGQKQRIAIARALVRDAPILLLDEATSALDAENERLVQQALHEAMSGRTTLVIAHRLSTVLEADRIVVMDAGRVVEEGRHADLLAGGGFYARVARMQFGGDGG
jgi:ATP-binding cassette, subfamily B, bacterial